MPGVARALPWRMHTRVAARSGSRSRLRSTKVCLPSVWRHLSVDIDNRPSQLTRKVLPSVDLQDATGGDSGATRNTRPLGARAAPRPRSDPNQTSTNPQRRKHRGASRRLCQDGCLRRSLVMPSHRVGIAGHAAAHRAAPTLAGASLWQVLPRSKARRRASPAGPGGARHRRLLGAILQPRRRH